MKRRRAKNFPLTVRYGRYRLTFRELVDRYGILKAAKVYRDATKRIGHGTLLMQQIGRLKQAHPRTGESKTLYRKAERILRAGLRSRTRAKPKRKARKKRKAARKVKRTTARKPKRKVKAKPKRKTPKRKAKVRKPKAGVKARKPKARKAKAKPKARKTKKVARKKKVAKVRAKAVKRKAAAKVIRGAWRSPAWPKAIKDTSLKAVSAWLKEAGGARDNKLAVQIAGTRPKQRLKALKALLKKAPKGVNWPEALKYTMYLVESPARPNWLVSVEGMMKQAAKMGAGDKAKKYFAAASALRKRLGRPPTTDEIAAAIVPDWDKKAAAN